MAESPAHRLGQIIGSEFEAAVHNTLLSIADEYHMYLDHKHARAARKGRKKVTWLDSLGNAHDLDYVLEDGGSETVIGRPRAFIEVAWRRYTKHSRAKAQEIQGAITPVAETYPNIRPFLGAILAGEFTEGSLRQLQSHGFEIVHWRYEEIVEAFRRVGLDVLSNEGTSITDLQRKVDAYDNLAETKRKAIQRRILMANESELNGLS